MKILRNASLVFSAGAAGAVANSFFLWQAGERGIADLFGVAIHPALSLSWLYPRIVWGGLLGLLLLIPVGRWSALLRGIFWSLVPSAASLLYFLPYQQGKGFLGQDLGTLTPLYVIAANAIWGAAAGLWMRFAGSSGVKAPSEG
ncbi:MAG: hypothetical protein AB1405_08525 [Bdellovibrionota bacterium]